MVRVDLVRAIHKIQSYNLFISAGMIVGFDQDDGSIFDEQYAFLQEAQIPIVMLSVLLAVPKTPLYNRLQSAGRLLAPDPTGTDRSHYVGTAGGTNFYPALLTREELQEGQQRLYQRLYAPEAFAARLLGNLSRFRDVRYQPKRLRVSNFVVLGRLVRHCWGKGQAARRFLWSCLWQCVRHSPRLVTQMVLYLGMCVHFCKVHGASLRWDPWQPSRPDRLACPPARQAEAKFPAAASEPDEHQPYGV
jgi:hypothetical protein